MTQHTSYTLEQQKAFLEQLLNEAQEHVKKDALKKQLQRVQTSITKCSSMKDVINIMNQFLVRLEQSSEHQELLDFLKDKNIYRILYRHPKIKGQEVPNDILRELLRNGYIGIAISLVVIGAFALSALLGAPAWIVAITSGLFMGSSVYLMTLTYGVLNDLFATHFNLTYFLLGHQPQQKSMLRTNDKIAQGVAWGVAATYGLGLLGAFLVGALSIVVAFFVPIATFALPVMVVGIMGVSIGAELFAQLVKYLIKNKSFRLELNEYQREGAAFMDPTSVEQASWIGNGFRNGFGFFGVPFIFLTGIAAIIALSATSMFLPVMLFVSPWIAVVVPAAIMASVALFLLAGGVYTYINRERHLDDRYNLEFDRDEVNYDLYLEEDKDYVDSLLNDQPSSGLTFFKEDINDGGIDLPPGQSQTPNFHY